MKQVKFEGSVEEYQGKKLPAAIPFSGVADNYENIGELKTSEDWPNDSDILKFVNRGKVTSAKAAAYQAATKELKTAYEASDEYKRKNFIESAVAAGASVEQAEALATQFLGARK